jgi:MoxR-like ATPase
MTTSTLTQTSNALDKWESIFGPNGFLADHNVEREEEIEILGLCVPSGVDHQLIGDPGVGKTWLIELLLKCLPGATLYNTLIMKEMSADEVLGPRSLKALKNDELIRLTLGFLPDANFGYLDEFWKGSPPVINALLSIMAERLLKYGGKVIDCSHIRAIILSSNELPDREDLGAARDRIGLTKHVQPVRSPEGKRRVADIQLADIEGDGLSLGDIPQLELVDIDQMGAEARAVIVPDTVREKAVEAHGKWEEAGFVPSQRRMKQMWRVAKQLAWSQGRTEMVSDDMMIWQHMAWNRPDDMQKAHDILIEFAGHFTQVADGHREAVEPIRAKLDEAYKKLGMDEAQAQAEDFDSAEQAHDRGFDDAFDALRDMKRLRRTVKKDIEEAVDQAQDTRELKKVLEELGADITRTQARLEKDDPSADLADDED